MRTDVKIWERRMLLASSAAIQQETPRRQESGFIWQRQTLKILGRKRVVEFFYGAEVSGDLCVNDGINCQ